MCGIAGIFGTPSRAGLDRMLAAVQHRGPDHTGTYVNDVVCLGMTRLSIIDISAQANQPMYSRDGRYVMVYNGEVYNYRSEREALERDGVRFHSLSDSEVTLQLYIKYGAECLKRLRGMFAFVVWDDREQTLFGARDPFGIKPFYYYHDQDRFVFCSELKGMLEYPGLAVGIDEEALNQYLYLGSPLCGKSMLSGVHALLPGRYFSLSRGRGLNIHRYWSLAEGERAPDRVTRYEEAVEQTRVLVMDSVHEQLVSDVPLGMFLSGGLDSNVIVAAAKAVGVKDIETFSIGFGDGAGVRNETELTRASSEFFDTHHHAETVTASDVYGQFDDYVKGLDQPSVDGLNTYLVSKLAKKRVTVAMSGLGADELFCGYNPFHKLLLNTRKPRSIDQVRDLYLRSVALLPGWLGEKVGNRILASHELSYYLASWNWVAPSVMGELTDQDADQTVFHLAEYIAEHVELSARRLNRIKQYAMFQYMGSMLLRDSDAVSMRHSLEVRFPFLDPRLVAFSFSLPDEMLIRPSARTLARRSYGIGCKKLLLDAFKHLLPPGFDQRRKNGFELPHNHWMRHGLRERIREVMLSGDPFFNRSVKERVYDSWLRGKASWKTVWSVFVFLCWWDRSLRRVTSLSR